MPTSLSRLSSRLAALAVGLCLASCTTVAPNGLSATDTANLRFTSVEVAAPSADIRWSAAEDDYLKGRNIPDNESALARTPEARGHIEGVAAARLKAALERRLATRTGGTRPARIVATIKSVSVPSTAQRIIIGGNPMIGADIAILDARTGTVLTRYSGDIGIAPAGAGLGGVLIDAALSAGDNEDLYDRAANDYARRFSAWLAAGA